VLEGIAEELLDGGLLKLALGAVDGIVLG